ncbi:MAG: ParB N-terminal domain-containing protein [Candidatus Krumholzibacteria bacterium]|nr:ParB N-terminal domain-containing protein [Candidatus Krumholzibacteria bacterium]
MRRLKLIDPQELHSHEAVDEAQVRRVAAMMKTSGYFHPPVLVDSATNVVLDGHHRVRASKVLGCNKIPCYCVDYLNDDEIVLESWKPETNPTKRDVIDMGLTENVFPRKTTRHLYEIPACITPAPLSDLIDGG